MIEQLRSTQFKVCLQELPPVGVWRIKDLNDFLTQFHETLSFDVGGEAELQDILKTEYLRERKRENYLYLYLRTDLKTSTLAVQQSARDAVEKSGFAQKIEVVKVSVRNSTRELM